MIHELDRMEESLAHRIFDHAAKQEEIAGHMDRAKTNPEALTPHDPLECLNSDRCQRVPHRHAGQPDMAGGHGRQQSSPVGNAGAAERRESQAPTLTDTGAPERPSRLTLRPRQTAGENLQSRTRQPSFELIALYKLRSFISRILANSVGATLTGVTSGLVLLCSSSGTHFPNYPSNIPVPAQPS